MAKTNPPRTEQDEMSLWDKLYPTNIEDPRFKESTLQAKYNYYANKLLPNMDSAKLAEFNKIAPENYVERLKLAEQYAKSNPDFRIDKGKAAELLGEKDYEEFSKTRSELEKLKGYSTSGTGEFSEDFGARNIGMIGPSRFKHEKTTDRSGSTKTQFILDKEVNWNPESGFTVNPKGITKGEAYTPPSETTWKMFEQSKNKVTPELKKGIDFSSVSAYKKWLAFGHASGEFAKTPGHQKVSIQGNKKEVKHKLENGLDFMKARGLDPNAPIDTKTLAKMPETKVPEVETPTPKPETDKQGMSSGMVSGITGAAGMAGDVVSALDSQDDGKKSVGGAALSGAASGAAMGATVGGPWGAAIGGVVGGAAGAVTAVTGNKKIDKAIKEENQHKTMVRSQSQFQPTQNTQSPIYENGTYASKMTEPVEVEKDEVVLRKGIDGLYKLVADFKGGKSHEKGGEDYILKEGDVVFPGKKRDKIMKSLETGDMSSIEEERAKLPKTLPNKLENGYIGSDKLNWWNEPMSRKEATVSPKTAYTPSTELQDKDLMLQRVEDNRAEVTKQIAEQEQQEKIARRGKLGESLENIGGYAPAISNIVQGMQIPSRVTKRFLTPDTLEYKDRSAGLRKESDIQARIDAENAARFSGGSAQVARAGKAMAGTAKSKRSQAISEGEAARADAIQAQNVGMRNQAKAGNLELANQYETMDAQNRAAVDAYFNRGMSDLYNIGRQKRMDKKMEKQQDLMLKMLEKRDFEFDKNKSEIKYKGKK